MSISLSLSIYIYIYIERRKLPKVSEQPSRSPHSSTTSSREDGPWVAGIGKSGNSPRADPYGQSPHAWVSKAATRHPPSSRRLAVALRSTPTRSGSIGSAVWSRASDAIALMFSMSCTVHQRKLAPMHVHARMCILTCRTLARGDRTLFNVRRLVDICGRQ